jgi:cellulose synthase/poly-beta-1,6-N-acetylglucosamine synthase-like glycosyltransferase
MAHMNTLTTHIHPVTARSDPASHAFPTAEHLDPMRPSRLPPFPYPHPAVEIVIPVYNEQRALRRSVHTLHSYMSTRFAYPFRITIADNASTDATLERATELASELREVRVLHLERKGRGHALRSAWSTSRPTSPRSPSSSPLCWKGGATSPSARAWPRERT